MPDTSGTVTRPPLVETEVSTPADGWRLAEVWVTVVGASGRAFGPVPHPTAPTTTRRPTADPLRIGFALIRLTGLIILELQSGSLCDWIKIAPDGQPVNLG